jgi:hypothetical protein
VDKQSQHRPSRRPVDSRLLEAADKLRTASEILSEYGEPAVESVHKLIGAALKLLEPPTDA